ncbi:MAG: hypothetical protein ACU84Q_04890, partial [Gammaproteobacteria bacterium]
NLPASVTSAARAPQSALIQYIFWWDSARADVFARRSATLAGRVAFNNFRAGSLRLPGTATRMAICQAA